MEKKEHKKGPKEVRETKDTDELHKSISNRDLYTRKIKKAVFESGATSNCGMVGDDFILTE